MPVFQTASYQVKPKSVERVKLAIKEFVEYVKENEPGTRFYAAWQQKDDPTWFMHVFIFEDEAAHATHGRSEAVKKFQSVYVPELVGGPVVFTDHQSIAMNRSQPRLE